MLWEKIAVLLRGYRLRSPSCSSRQPQHCWISRLGSYSQGIAVFTMVKIVLSTIDVPIGSIDSSSPGQCHENSCVLVSPALFPAMLKLNGSTWKSVEVLQRTSFGEDLWLEVSSLSLLDLYNIRNSKWSIGAMKYKPMCTTVLFLVGVSLRLCFHPWRPTGGDISHAASPFWSSRIALSVMYYFLSGGSDSRSLSRVTWWLIRVSHCAGWVPCLLIILMDWTTTQTHSLTLSSIHSVVKLPLSCQITQGCCCPWADSTSRVLGPDTDMPSWYLDCISIYDNIFPQPVGIVLQIRISTLVNNCVVDIECLLP